MSQKCFVRNLTAAKHEQEWVFIQCNIMIKNSLELGEQDLCRLDLIYGNCRFLLTYHVENNFSTLCLRIKGSMQPPVVEPSRRGCSVGRLGQSLLAPLKGGCIGYRFPLSFLFTGRRGRERGREGEPDPSPRCWLHRRTKQQARHLSHFGHCQEDASQERTKGGEVEYITVYVEAEIREKATH